jgi:nitrogen fixation protein NifU and related proteins
MAHGDEQLYQDHILEHYEEPYHRGQCANCTHAHEDDNPLCGDVIRMELQIDDQGTLKEACFDGDGCCISQAAASMLVERFDGKRIEEVKKFTANDMLELFGARLTPNRQKCCLLSWRVLQAAIYSPVNGHRPAPDQPAENRGVSSGGSGPQGASSQLAPSRSSAPGSSAKDSA